MILSDNETKIDLLNNEAIALTIVGLIDSRKNQPMTIGVHGDWGAGKSSILEMIAEQLNGKEKVLCLKFNGWRFQGFEDAKIALIEGIVTSLIEKRPALTKAADKVKDIFERIDWLKVAKRTGGLAFTAFTGVPTPDQIQTVVKTLQGFAANPGELATKENLETVINEVGSFIKPKENKNIPNEIKAFREAFDALLKAADVDQLVVLIDDLDRCLPDNAIETLEAVRLFVFTSGTAFVVAADEAMIEYAVRKHFPDLPETTGPRDYARNYLEKLIQIPFRIPALGEVETRTYVTLLLVSSELGDESEVLKKLIPVARERLKRPWVAGSLELAQLKETLGDEANNVESSLYLSNQLGPLLASGSQGNPRQIKRFLNTLLLRHRIAEARGFGQDIKIPILAKLMLAERFIPRLFEQMAAKASDNPDGTCTDLVELETNAKADQQSDNGKSSEESTDKEPAAKNKPESVLLGEWLSNPSIVAWAKIDPPLGGVDFRPYLFITKDKKDYLERTSALGQLGGVVDQLMGSKMAVQALVPKLKQLTPQEFGLVFEAICQRIINADSFETEPSGIHGLSALVKEQASLEFSLVEFLERLPRERLGPWACKGWTSIITNADAVARFKSLQEVWKEQGSPMLKAAISSTQRIAGGRK